MKVLLLTKYPRIGASSRLRTLQFLPLLKESGFEFTVQSLFDEAYLKNLYNNGSRSKAAITKYYLKRLITLITAYRYDLIWIEYEIFPYLPASAERFLSFLKKDYIVDYDDAVFHRYNLSSNPFIRMFLSKKIDTVMQKSSCVVVGNAYLIEYAKNSGAKYIEWVPTVVDGSRYKVEANEEVNEKVIGWIGSPSTEKYILDIKESLTMISRKYHTRLLLVGATKGIVDKLPGMKVDVVPWDELTEASFIRKMDIGIMPLVDGPWEKGKCGYKLIQYMACGIPVVASPVGVNPSIVNNSKSGYLAENNEQWYICLDKLLRSSIRCETFGVSGRAAIDSIYSLQVQAPVLARIFNSIVKKGAF
ncbi:glycosyltransferase family 4 protein [Psychrobacter sp. UBA2769]|uniref:glycosyltransferase family 4 protein n=1 Tax=Psychrobacter sp. UBA2769 TaxID=1947348 RepID=UPI0025D20201|nr:glycosyltransferase family 4 protein [Psychrobacter sp. UBA2769]